MTVLNPFPNGATGADVRDTINNLFAGRPGFNLSREFAPRLSAAMAQCDAGVLPSRYFIGIIGDSTTAPYRASSDLKANGYFQRGLTKLQQHSPIDENGMFGMQGATLASISNWDPTITVGAGITIATDESLGGMGFTMTNATGPLTKTLKACDSIEIDLIAGSGGGTVSYQIDGGAATNIVGPTSNFQRTTISVALGAHTVAINQVSGGATVVGISGRNTTVPRLMLGNWARGGASTTSWTTINSVGPNRSPINAAYLMTPVAVVINLGINDSTTALIPVATFQANLQTLIDKYKVDSDVILMVPFPSDLTTYTTQLDYYAAIRAMAAAQGLPLIDLPAIMGAYASANTRGLYSDNRHPSPGGQAYVASAVSEAFRLLR